MKKTALLALYLVPILLLPTIAYARVNVDISNNKEGSKNTVTINNTINAKSSTSNSTSNIKTDIRIESNGEVKEYHSEGNEDINLESSDGNSKVSVTNRSGASNNTQSSPSASISPPSFNLIEFLKAQLSLIKLFGLFSWI